MHHWADCAIFKRKKGKKVKYTETRDIIIVRLFISWFAGFACSKIHSIPCHSEHELLVKKVSFKNENNFFDSIPLHEIRVMVPIEKNCT